MENLHAIKRNRYKVLDSGISVARLLNCDKGLWGGREFEHPFPLLCFLYILVTLISGTYLHISSQGFLNQTDSRVNYTEKSSLSFPIRCTFQNSLSPALREGGILLQPFFRSTFCIDTGKMHLMPWIPTSGLINHLTRYIKTAVCIRIEIEGLDLVV